MTYPISLNTDGKGVTNLPMLVEWYQKAQPTWGLCLAIPPTG